MSLPQYTATLLGSSWQWVSLSTPPYYWGAVGSGSPLVHRHTDGEQWAVGLLKYTAILPGSSGQWVSFSTPPH